MSQSVFPNSDFFKKIMLGMRVVHLIFLLLYLSTSVVAYSASDAESKSNHPVFDCAIGEHGKRALLRLPKGNSEVTAILYCHQNMTEEVLFRSKLFTDRMDSLGVAMAFVQQGSLNWDTSSGCQERFDSIISGFASATGHQEISTAPIIPFGHSAQATFPWNFAAWNPQRTLCIISYHGDAPRTNLCGYGRANIEWGRTRNIDSIPGLMIEGEYEWWEARVRPALAFRMMYPESRISFLCDAGRGHFDLGEDTQLYIARFIEKSLADPRPAGGEFYSRWHADGSESSDPHDCFWYHDSEMVDRTRLRYSAAHGDIPRYVSAKISGQTVDYDSTRHVRMSFPLRKVLPTSAERIPDGFEFTVEPFFSNADRISPVAGSDTSDIKVVLISGPAIQTGPYTFCYDPDYFGHDPKRLWSGITLTLEAPGDSTYLPAIQELNISIPH